MKADLIRAENQAARGIAAQSFNAMSPSEFEATIAALCKRDGCSHVQITGGSGDLGADIVAVTSDGLRCVIQAKRYAAGNLVSSPDLQKFGGTCYSVHGADVAALVTTSGFTKHARSYAEGMRIVLFDGASLADWAARSGPSPWLALPPSLRPTAAIGMEARGKHARR